MYQPPSIPETHRAALQAAVKPAKATADKLLRLARVEAERAANDALVLTAFLRR